MIQVNFASYTEKNLRKSLLLWQWLCVLWMQRIFWRCLRNLQSWIKLVWEARTKFQLSHIGDVGGEERRGRICVCIYAGNSSHMCSTPRFNVNLCFKKKTLPLDQSESQQFVKKSSQTKQSIGWCMTWNRLSWDWMAICHYVQFQHGLHNWITRICCGYLKRLTTFCYNSLK